MRQTLALAEPRSALVLERESGKEAVLSCPNFEYRSKRSQIALSCRSVHRGGARRSATGLSGSHRCDATSLPRRGVAGAAISAVCGQLSLCMTCNTQHTPCHAARRRQDTMRDSQYNWCEPRAKHFSAAKRTAAERQHKTRGERVQGRQDACRRRWGRCRGVAERSGRG
jgi:hypothetical protein